MTMAWQSAGHDVGNHAPATSFHVQPFLGRPTGFIFTFRSAASASRACLRLARRARFSSFVKAMDEWVRSLSRSEGSASFLRNCRALACRLSNSSSSVLTESF